MASPEARAYTTDHPHNHRHNSPKTPTSHRSSFTSPLSHLTTLTHAPSVFLGGLHRHERELVINHQHRVAKKEANAAIEKYESGFYHPGSPSSLSSPSSSTSSGSPTKGAASAAKAAMGAGATEEDEAEWAAIVAARAAATRRSATLDFEKEMAEERRRRVLQEIEAESKGIF